MKPRSAKASRRWKGCYRHALTPIDYLEQRILKTPTCWLWLKGKDKDGYGQCQAAFAARENCVTRAHQLAWIAWRGVIPKGKLVCHTCDNPSCVNPDHLFLGSHNDNVQDMMQKGRYKHPYSNGDGSKLTKEQKQEIKDMSNSGKTSLEVGKMYNVTFSRVCQIWRGE